MKAKRLFIYIILFATSFTGRGQVVNKNYLLGNDYHLFQETPVWILAKAVRSNNLKAIKKLVIDKKLDIDYQEPIFGQTLLILAVTNEQYKASKTLLELGANPNKHSTSNGNSAMIEAAQVNSISNDNTKFLKLLLKFKGNPNDVEVGERTKGRPIRKSVLIASIQVNKVYSCLLKVKLIVESGADINYKNEYGQTALSEAVILDTYDIVLYLLQKGANYQETILDRTGPFKGGKKAYLVDMLREYIPPLGSDEFKQKMQVVEFLKQKGIDYKKVPIPDYTIKEIKEVYPNNWKEYMEKY